MGDLRADYSKPTYRLGPKIAPDSEARFFSGQEHYDVDNSRKDWFWTKMGLIYASALGTYVYCTRNGMRAQRLLSTITMISVPWMVLWIRKGDDMVGGHFRQRTVEERLEFYPITRRALDRAIAKVEEKSSEA